MLTPIGIVLVAYLLGSVPFGVIFARAKGIDIQRVGSGNIGATNVARQLGKKLGALVLLLDAAKGALPVAAALWLAPGAWVAPACALAAVVGHCFPPWLRFHGGKGVATALGVFAVLDPPALGVALLVFALVYAACRIVSAGSLAAALAFPLAAWWLGAGRYELAAAVAVTLLIIARHRDNLARLRRGAESGMRL